MTEITAEQVKSLREQTGVGMMECKAALKESGGDAAGAIKILRERGMASAGKRAGRSTKEGVVLACVNGSRGTIVAISCETEPVAGTAEFKNFAGRVLEAVDRDGPAALANHEADRVQLVAKIGENIQVKSVERFETSAGHAVAEYLHRPANKIGVLVEFSGGPGIEKRPAEFQRISEEIAMQIAATNPLCVDKDGVPADRVAEEKSILEKQIDPAKPPQIREKIVAGKLNSFYEQVCLLEQPYIREPKKKIRMLLSELAASLKEDVKVRRFVRLAVGE